MTIGDALKVCSTAPPTCMHTLTQSHTHTIIRKHTHSIPPPLSPPPTHPPSHHPPLFHAECHVFAVMLAPSCWCLFRAGEQHADHPQPGTQYTWGCCRHCHWGGVEGLQCFPTHTHKHTCTHPTPSPALIHLPTILPLSMPNAVCVI